MASAAFDLAQLPQGWRPIPERVQSSLTDSDRSTNQTVQLMVRHIRESLADPRIIDIASRTAGKWGRGPVAQRVCWDVFWFCKHRVRFTLDEHAVLGLLGETDQVDFLISPPVLMRMLRPAGDCDDFTMLACALLEANGVPWEIVTVATDGTDPGRWSHVYLRAVLEDGRHIPLDPTNGPYPGWEVPERDVHRRQIWNMEGNPVQGVESARRDLRMHAYVPQRRRRGMGDQLGSGEVSIEGSALPGDVSSTTLNPYGYTVPYTAPAASSGSGLNLNSLLSSLIGSGTSLAKMALLPSGSSLLPSGAVISPYGAAGGLLTSGSTVGGISTGTIMVIAAIGLGIVLIAGRK